MDRYLSIILAVVLSLVLCAGMALEDEAAPETETMSAAELAQLGDDAYNAGDYEKALAYYQQAADQGFAEAQNSLADMYYYGEGVEQSYEKALEYYQQAAELGYEQALDYLNALVEEGHVSEEYLAGLTDASETPEEQ